MDAPAFFDEGPYRAHRFAMRNMRDMERSMSKQAIPAVISIAEAARLLGVSGTTVRRLIRNESLSMHRIGGRVLIPTQDVKRLLAGK